MLYRVHFNWLYLPHTQLIENVAYKFPISKNIFCTNKFLSTIENNFQQKNDEIKNNMSLKSKIKKVKSRFMSILFWSVISAAFIGPGTVTTATNAGASFGFDLLWTFVFSTIACVVLQEASARITVYSGKNLGQAIARHFEGHSARTLVLILIVGAIIVGCAAYETGNILGSVIGLSFIIDLPEWILVLGVVILSFICLNLPSLQSIAKFMGFTVIVMGFAFLGTAIYLEPDYTLILKGSFIPTIPDGNGAGLLILGLIGTTVVPYDLFLGSGIVSKSQTIGEMRFGLSVAIILGGIISMSILSVGTIITGEFSFEALTQALVLHTGKWAVIIFGIGMFAAGFSSAITAPLASAITAQSLFEGKHPEKWDKNSRNFRAVWLFVLLVGLGFGLADIKPIPAIILAQALNGLILPFISIFIIFVVNDPTLMGREGINGWVSNILMGIIVWVTLILGLTNVIQAIESVWDIASRKGIFSMEIISIIALLISLLILGKIYKIRTEKRNKMKIMQEDNNMQSDDLKEN